MQAAEIRCIADRSRPLESFGYKSLKRFFENDDGRKLPADILERIRAILTLLDSASAVEDLDRPALRLAR